MPDPSNIIDSETASTILKWAVTILIAGFIAQFGKKFANYLVEKIRSFRKGKKATGDGSARDDSTEAGGMIHDTYHSTAVYQAAAEKARLKLEKKKLKNSMKEQKK
jgi:hypothetical protein